MNYVPGSRGGGPTETMKFKATKMTKMLPVVQQMAVPREFRAAMRQERRERSESKTSSLTTHLPSRTVGDLHHGHSISLSTAVE